MQIHKGKWDEQNDIVLRLKREKDDLVVKQNELWRKETKLSADKQQKATELRGKESQLQGTSHFLMCYCVKRTSLNYRGGFLWHFPSHEENWDHEMEKSRDPKISQKIKKKC